MQIIGHLQNVEHEGLYLVCYSCDQYRHKAFECLSIAVTGAAPLPGFSVPQLNTVEPPMMEERTATYGPWMVVQPGRQRRPRNSGEKIELSIITDVQLMFKDSTGIRDSRRVADVTSLDLRDSVLFQFGQHESTSIPI